MSVGSNQEKNVSNNEWDLVYVLPNLRMEEPFESNFISITPYHDERLQKIISQDDWAKKLLTGFKTETGEQIEPCALLLRKDVPESVKSIESVVTFRNILAISSLFHSCCRALKSPNISEPSYSDHFDFYPYMLAKEGGFHSFTPAKRDMWLRPEKLYGQIYSHIPNFDFIKANPDKMIADRILRQWKARFISPRKDTWKTRILFRSIEVAYQALGNPFRHYSLYEHGTYLSLWVCAIEIFSHKKRGVDVNFSDVIDLLGKYEWVRNKWNKLNAKRYKIYRKKSKPRGNLVQKLYKELYKSRCDFLHGNAIKPIRLYPFRNEKLPHLVNLAPIIYWVAFSVYLNTIEKTKSRIGNKSEILKSDSELDYEEALLLAKGKKFEDVYSGKK